MPMKILLLGKNGQVGWELQRSLAPLGEVIALDHDGAPGLSGDFAHPESLAATVRDELAAAGYAAELYDIEHELAGFETYDRQPKFVGYDLNIINSDDFIGVDTFETGTTLRIGETLSLPIYVSLYGVPTFDSGVIKWRMMRGQKVLGEGSMDAQNVKPFTVTELAPLKLTVPNDRGLARLWVDLYDGTTRRATNFVDLIIRQPKS